MKVVEALNALAVEPGETDIAEAPTLKAASAEGGAPSFWVRMVLAGLSVLRAFVKMDGDQSTAWDTVVSLIQSL